MSQSNLTRPSPGLGVAPGALFVSLMSDEHHHAQRAARPIRRRRRRLLRRI
jgi:hypothetical protein